MDEMPLGREDKWKRNKDVSRRRLMVISLTLSSKVTDKIGPGEDGMDLLR